MRNFETNGKNGNQDGGNADRIYRAHIQTVAIELVRRGARSGCVKRMLPHGPNDHQLTQLQKQVHGKQASKMAGRIPNSSASVFKTPEGRIEATRCLLVYQQYSLGASGTLYAQPDHGSRILIDPLAVCYAYDESDRNIIGNATSVWLLARDAMSRTIAIRRCDTCHAQHIFFERINPSVIQNRCPHCMVRKKNLNS